MKKGRVEARLGAEQGRIADRHAPPQPRRGGGNVRRGVAATQGGPRGGPLERFGGRRAARRGAGSRGGGGAGGAAGRAGRGGGPGGNKGSPHATSARRLRRPLRAR